MSSKTIKASVVIDKGTSRIVYFEEEVVGAATGVPIPNFPGHQSRYVGNIAFDDGSGFDVNTCFHYKMDAATGAVSQVADDAEAVMVEMALWNRKFQINEALLAKITNIRKNHNKPLYGQAAVYSMKAQQARNFRRSGYKTPAAFPMVVDYAEVTGKNPRQAADQILRKAREGVASMRRTEKARMIYKAAIFRATSFEDLSQVADNITNL